MRGRGGGRGFGRGRGRGDRGFRGRGRGGRGFRGGGRGTEYHYDHNGVYEDGGRIGMLSEETLSYYRNVFQTLQNGLGEGEDGDPINGPEVKEEFMNNVFAAFKDEAVQVSQNQTVSWIIESLFAQANPKHLRSVLGPFFNELTLTMFDRFASHVLQALVEYLPAMYEDTSEQEAVDFEVSLNKLLQFANSHLRDIMTHTYGSHVLRSLLEALGGVKVTEQIVRQKQGKGSMSKKEKAVSPLLDYEKYRSFSEDYKSSFGELKDKVIKLCDFADHFTDISYSTVMQTVLLILHKSSPLEYTQLSDTIIERTCVNWREDTESHDPADRLPQIVQSDVGSYLFELLLTLAPQEQLKSLFATLLKGRIIYFCVHPRANFVFQALLAAVTDKTLVTEILEEIRDYFEDILAVNHIGIITKLASACQRTDVGQDKVLQLLMSAFHCYEPESRQLKVVPLVASFQTFEVYHKKDKEANETESSDIFLKDVVIHGALILQQLFLFTTPDIVVASLLALTSTELAILACHQNGSHVIDVFLTSDTVNQKSKDSFLKKILGTYVMLATSKHGSRCLDNIWKDVSLSQRIMIAEDLSKHLDRLEGDFYGKFICFNFGLLKFKHRHSEWLQLQGASTKKQRVLKEVLKGKPKKDKHRVLDEENVTLHSQDTEVKTSKSKKKKRKPKGEGRDEDPPDLPAEKKRKTEHKHGTQNVIEETLATDRKLKQKQKTVSSNEQSKMDKVDENAQVNIEAASSEKRKRKKEKKRVVRGETANTEPEEDDSTPSTKPQKMKKTKAEVSMLNENFEFEGTNMNNQDGVSEGKKKKKRKAQNKLQGTESGEEIHKPVSKKLKKQKKKTPSIDVGTENEMKMLTKVQMKKKRRKMAT